MGLFSDVTIEQVQKVLLDYQSRTSVNLARILLHNFWKCTPECIPAGENYISDIRGTTAGVVIGDRAFRQRKVSDYYYDLGSAWRKMTNLPFVFAAWVANKPLDAEFLNTFNQANAFGIESIDEVIKENPYDLYDLSKYFRENISYDLSADKRKGLEVFLGMLQQQGTVPH